MFSSVSDGVPAVVASVTTYGTESAGPPTAVPAVVDSVTTSGTDSDSSGPVEIVSGRLWHDMPFGDYIEGARI